MKKNQSAMQKTLGGTHTKSGLKTGRGSDHDSAGASRNSKQKPTPSMVDKTDEQDGGQLNDLDMSAMNNELSESARSDDLSKESELEKYESRQSND